MFGKKSNKPETETPAASAPASESAPETTEVKPAAETLTPEQIKELQERATKSEEKAKDSWDRLLRTTADFDNFKKRAAREKIESAQYATASLLGKILPVLDNFEMAITAAQNSPGEKNSALSSGVSMIQSQLKSVLVEAGLEEIDAAGKPFDPAFHEAVSQQETDAVPEDHVAQQLRKGYKLKERLIRPAMVVVAKKPAAK